jgi:uncharacterized membrane protein YccC
MNYDTQQLYNMALAMLIGLSSAAVAFRLAPPLSPALRTRRLLALTSRDLRRLTNRPAAWTTNEWKNRLYRRLCALPPQAEPSQRAQLLMAISTGSEIIRLHRVARQFQLQGQVEDALQAMSRGDRSGATERLGQVDGFLTAPARVTPGAWGRLRARASIHAISEALAHPGLLLEPGEAQ